MEANAWQKMQQNSLQAPRTILELVGRVLDQDIFQVTHEDVKDTDLGHPHVVVSQHGASAAPTPANHLVSSSDARVVAVVERDADVDAAAKALVMARFGLGGKSPYAPDVVLVSEWVKDDFLAAATRYHIQFMPKSGDEQQRDRFSGPGLLDEIIRRDGAQILAPTPDGGIVEVQARYDRHRAMARLLIICSLCHRNSLLIRRKPQEPWLVIHPVTSMDGAIDLSLRWGTATAFRVLVDHRANMLSVSVLSERHMSLRNRQWPNTSASTSTQK